MICKKCGEEGGDGKFCIECGAKLPPREEFAAPPVEESRQAAKPTPKKREPEGTLFCDSYEEFEELLGSLNTDPKDYDDPDDEDWEEDEDWGEEKDEGKYKSADLATVLRDSKAEVSAAVTSLALRYVRGEIRDTDEATMAYVKRYAAHTLGELYYFGVYAVDQDYAKAVKWFALSHRANPSDAYLAGMCYLWGDDKLKSDFKEAFRWFLIAAEAGDPLAAEEAAASYARGRGTARDMNEAIRWYTRAAKDKDTEGAVRLGDIYRTGENGVPKNAALAEKWYRVALKQGHTDVKKYLK